VTLPPLPPRLPPRHILPIQCPYIPGVNNGAGKPPPPDLPDGMTAQVVATDTVRVDVYGEVHGNRVCLMMSKADFNQMIRTLAKVSTQA
jgi:hypothetical protein